MVADPDHNLVRQIQSTDPEIWEPAFEELHDKYAKRVFNVAAKILGNQTDAADVTQEAFVIVFKHIEGFSFESRFFTWLYRVVLNLALDRRKKNALNSFETLSSFDQSGPSDSGPAGGPRSNGQKSSEGRGSAFAEPRSELEDIVEKEHIEVRVQWAMNRLSPKLKSIVHLRYTEGLSYVEIGEILECSMGTVKSRLSRAHAVLEDALSSEFHSSGGLDAKAGEPRNKIDRDPSNESGSNESGSNESGSNESGSNEAGA